MLNVITVEERTMKHEPQEAVSLHLALGTISFTLCFAAWGLISAFAPQFRKLFELTATQSAALVAVPVLLGSIARIPVGMLTDRLGGRLVFSGLMALCAAPAFSVPLAGSFAGPND
jgi:NNP family nitrate/nitrite transporter-like MFS transporter